jgi:hypothetical protein
MTAYVAPALWFGGQYSCDWTSAHVPRWKRALEPVRLRPLRVLEIGAWEGRSAIFFLKHLPRSKLTCIDTFEGTQSLLELPEHAPWVRQIPYVEARFDRNVAPFGGRVEKLKGRTRDRLDALLRARRRYDVIYVDASHRRDDVLQDSQRAWSLLRPGGLLIWDDYGWRPKYAPSERPREAIDRLLAAWRGRYRLLHKDYQVIVRRTAPAIARPTARVDQKSGSRAGQGRAHGALIGFPQAWTARDIPGKAGFARALAADEVAAIWEDVAKSRAKPTERLTRADFDTPLISSLMNDVRTEIITGGGAVVLTGLELSGRSADDLGRAHWGLGVHLGEAAVNNAKGERLCRVQHETDARLAGHGYRRNITLRPHSDFHEVIGLAAFARAAVGGETVLVSSAAIHNVCLVERPDLLEALYEGYYQVLPGASDVSEEKVPVFCDVDGVVSLDLQFGHYEAAAAKLNEPVPPRFAAARHFLEVVSMRPELQVRFCLEPGEILFWHNFAVLHARDAFTDSADRRRLLLRLWLNLKPGRPMHPSFRARARALDALNERTAGQTVAEAW